MPSSASDTIAIPELNNVRGNPQWNFAGIEEPDDNTHQSTSERRLQKGSGVSKGQPASSSTSTATHCPVTDHRIEIRSANNLPPAESEVEDVDSTELVEVHIPLPESQQDQHVHQHKRRYLSRLMANIIHPFLGPIVFPFQQPPQQPQNQQNMIVLADGRVIIIPMGGGGGGAAPNEAPKWVELDITKLGEGAGGNGNGNQIKIENMHVYHFGNA